VAGAKNYAVQVRKVHPYTTGWSSPYLLNATSVRYSGFRTGDSYEWRLQAHCDDGSSDFATLVFTMGQNARRVAAPNTFLYPNPAGDQVTVNLLAIAPAEVLPSPVDTAPEFGPSVGISLIDITGRQLLFQPVNEQAATVELNTSTLAPGIYFVKVTDAEGQMIEAQKLVIK